jgi:hypothetical protein
MFQPWLRAGPTVALMAGMSRPDFARLRQTLDRFDAPSEPTDPANVAILAVLVVLLLAAAASLAIRWSVDGLGAPQIATTQE